MIHVNDIKTGMTFKYEDQIYIVLEFLHVKPGKGPAFMRAKLKNLRSGATIEKTFNTNIKFEKAVVLKVPMQYLYQAGNRYCFMNMETYEQIELSEEQISESKKFLKEGLDLNINFYNNEVLDMQLPEKITYRVIETESVAKGNTVNNTNKEAKLENDLMIKVPMFIKNDDLILISTKTGQYDSRA